MLVQWRGYIKITTIIIKCTRKKLIRNKISLNSDDNKRLQTFNRVATYPYGTIAFKLCEREMMVLRDFVC